MRQYSLMTSREKTLAKLSASMDEKKPCSFEPLEAKLAGIFKEDAIGVDDLDEEDD